MAVNKQVFLQQPYYCVRVHTYDTIAFIHGHIRMYGHVPCNICIHTYTHGPSCSGLSTAYVYTALTLWCAHAHLTHDAFHCIFALQFHAYNSLWCISVRMPFVSMHTMKSVAYWYMFTPGVCARDHVTSGLLISVGFFWTVAGLRVHSIDTLVRACSPDS
jgi:hypothetical protein